MKAIYPSFMLVMLVVSCTPLASSSESSSLTSSELALLPAKEALYTEQQN